MAGMYASPLFSFFAEHYIKVPGDLSVVGYNNMVNVPSDQVLNIDSLEQPWGKIGRYALKRITEKIEKTEHVESEVKLIRPVLIKKGSVIS